MSRTLFFAVASLALLTLVSSSAVASYAGGSGSQGPPELRPNLPAAALPTISLDEATSVKLGNLLRPHAAERFGITPDSYARARILATTSVGTFYVIPGSRGACIVTLSATSCGDPGSPGDPMLALAKATTPAGDEMVGVGIATAGTERVAMPSGSRVVSLPVANGLFHIRERVSLPAIRTQSGTGRLAKLPRAPRVTQAKAALARKRSAKTVRPFGYEDGGPSQGTCTRYTRHYSVGLEYCYQYELTLTGGSTQGVAIRYLNQVGYADGPQWWNLWYSRDDGEYWCCMTLGSGWSGSIEGSHGQYKAASCATPWAGILEYMNMYCSTHW